MENTDQRQPIKAVQHLNLQDLSGEYYLVGVYNSTTREIFHNFDSAKNFKVQIEYSEAEKQVNFDFKYEDTKENKPHSVLAKYSAISEVPAVLVSPMAILMFKQYNGDQDMVVHHFQKGNLVLVQQDLSTAYFLSKDPKPSQEQFATSKILTDLGLQVGAYKEVNNSG